MKKLFCLLLVLGAFNFAQANNIEEGKLIANTKVVKEDVIHLTVANLQGFRTRLELTDLAESTSFYSQSLKERNGFGVDLNLSELADGKYLFTIKNNGTKLQQVIRIKEGMILYSQFK